MTTAEARYVLANRHLYDDATYHYALEIVESADRQDRNHQTEGRST